MVELLAAFALTPWAHPLGFAPQQGWHTGASGTVRSAYGGRMKGAQAPSEWSAWMATDNVRYRDRATADPPNATLAQLPPAGVIVWAVIFEQPQRGDKPIRLDLSRAKRFDCCEGAYVRGGEYELSGAVGGEAYSMIVRIYFGSRPSRALRAKAQFALDRLQIPARHSAVKTRLRGPWPLVSVGALGLVTWRCDLGRVRPSGLAGLALGFVAGGGQTGSIRLSVGGRTVIKHVTQPGQRIQFPFLRARVERLDISESGENGTLRATVVVDFTPRPTTGYCWPYAPPKVDLRLTPRR